MQTLTDAFGATAAAHGDRVALRVGEQVYTHGDLDRLSDRLAAQLHRDGVRPGMRVGVHLGNGAALVVAHLAIGKTGAIRLCINPAYRTAELAHIVADAAPALVFTESPDALRAAGHAGSVIVPGGGHDPFETSAGRPPAPSIGPDTPALMAYTSGTTGQAKGAVLSHRNLLSNIRTLAELWRWTADDRLLLALPMFHLHGLGLGLHGSLLTGGELRLHERFDAGDVLAGLPEATMCFGVPTIWRRLVDHPRAGDLSPLRLATSGSAPLPPALWHTVRERLGLTLLERYGLTETMMNASHPFDDRRPGTVGPPLPGVELRLGERDEVLVRGPNVICEYWNRGDPRGADGWFATGDVGRLHDGHLVICGRLKALIITGGYNVHPREVEDALAEHPEVIEAAVVGLPHEVWGEAVTAFYVPRDAPLAEGRLVTWMGNRLASYKVPRAFHAVRELPRNAMGKLDRASLGGGL